MNDEKITRSGIIQRVAMAPIAIGAFAALQAEAEAAASIDKSAAQYQDKPKNGAECSTCTFFIPGKSKTAAGTCKLVKGTISPHGWCKFYHKK
jgi:hypothetical protein